MSLDLSTLDSSVLAEQGATLVIMHPLTKEDTDITIKLAGMDSATYRRAEAQLAEQYSRRRGAKRGPDDFRRDGIATLAACTVSWENMLCDGETLSCTRDNAKKIYTRFPWIYEQVQEFISARENFLQDSKSACVQP